MANEELVANVLYKGVNVGTSRLTVEDTSFLPDYTFKVVRLGTEVTDLTNLQQLNTYDIEFEQDVVIPEMNAVYVRTRTVDSKFLITANNQAFGGPRDEDRTLALNALGKGRYRFSLDFFPSYTGYGAVVEFYHDEARTLLIQSFNLNAMSVIGGGPFIQNAEQRTRAGLYPDEIELGKTLNTSVSVSGPSIIEGATVVPFVGRINGVVFKDSPYLVDGSVTPNVTVSKANNIDGNPLVGFTPWATKPEYTSAFKPLLIEMKMGEAVATNKLVRPSAVDGFVWQDVLYDSVPIYQRGQSSSETIVGIAQGHSPNTDLASRLGPVVIGAQVGMVSNIVVHAPNYDRNDTEGYNALYQGPVAAVSIVPSKLTTELSRAQFGKFQKAFTVNFNSATPKSLTWADLTDPIADALYGVPASIIGSDLVILTQAYSRADMAATFFNVAEWSVNAYKFGADGLQVLPFSTRIDILALRRSEMLDTYPEGTPYPRVIKADKHVGVVSEGEGLWVIDIPASSSIDLREDRYVVQHQNEMTIQGGGGGNAFPSWENCRIVKEKSRISIYGSSRNSSVDPKHYVIWDLGPGTKVRKGNQDAIKGDHLGLVTEQWESKVEIGTSVTAGTALLMPTLGGINTTPATAKNKLKNVSLTRVHTTLPTNFVSLAYWSDTELYTGSVGLLSLNTDKMKTVGSRDAFVGLHKALVVDPDSAGKASFNLSEIKDPVGDYLTGSITDLTASDVVMVTDFLPSVSGNGVTLRPDSIEVKNTGSTTCNLLVAKAKGWIKYPDDGSVSYPRLVYANKLPLSGNGVKITVDPTVIVNPRDSRVQVLCTLIKNTPELTPVAPVTLIKTATELQFEFDGASANNLLHVLVMDFGPGAIFNGQCTVPSIGKSTFNDHGTVFSYIPTFSKGIPLAGDTKTDYLTKYGCDRNVSTGKVTVWGEGQFLDTTWGGSRNSGRGVVGWSNKPKDVASMVSRTLGMFVARHHSTIGDTGITWADLRDELAHSHWARRNNGNAFNPVSFLDSNLVIIPSINLGGETFKFSVSSDGKTLTYRNSNPRVSGDATSVMEIAGNQRVDTLLLNKKVVYAAGSGTSYPHLIYADRIPFTDQFGKPTATLNLAHSGYTGLDFTTGRYQLMKAMESSNHIPGTNGFKDVGVAKNQWGVELITDEHFKPEYGLGCILHVAIWDFGPDYDK